MHRWSPLSILFLAVALASSTGCSSGARALSPPQPARSDTLDVQSIARIVGVEGTEKDGRYKITVPQNDLRVTVDGFEIIPPMGMGSWAAFAPAAHGAVVMGDVIVREEEIGPVQRVVHNHTVHEEPRIFFLHFWGTGAAERLARGLKAALDQTGR